MTCHFNDNEYFVREFESQNADDLDFIQKLLTKTKNVQTIARFFIIDAVLSKFGIEVQEAIDCWNRELNAIQEIHKAVQKLTHLPKSFRAARFGLQVLKHLLLRGREQTVCSYAENARNFIVALVKTNQCLCFSYTMYVQAVATHFGYNDLLETCSIPGHVFNITKQEGDVPTRISFDAGFYHNTFILYDIWNPAPFTEQQAKDMLVGTDPMFRYHKQSQYMCEENERSNASFPLYNLIQETQTKHTVAKILRSLYILGYLFPKNPYIREYIKRSLEESRLAFAYFSDNDNERAYIAPLTKSTTEMANCLQSDPEHYKLWRVRASYADPVVVAADIIRSMFGSSVRMVLSRRELLPPSVDYILELIQDIVEVLSNKRARFQLDYDETLGVNNNWNVLLPEQLGRPKQVVFSIRKISLKDFATTRIPATGTIMHQTSVVHIIQDHKNYVMKPEKSMPEDFILYYDTKEAPSSVPLNQILILQNQPVNAPNKATKTAAKKSTTRKSNVQSDSPQESSRRAPSRRSASPKQKASPRRTRSHFRDS